MDERIAVFPGSFDPMTKGHMNIVYQAALLFDRLIIAIGKNSEKKPLTDIENRVLEIQKTTKNFLNVEVKTYQTLTVDFCNQIGARFIVRGLRNIFDFEYEKNMAHINEKIGNIKTIFLISSPEFSHISSSLIRELKRQGKNISEFLP